MKTIPEVYYHPRITNKIAGEGDLVSSGGTGLHVFLERLSLGDGLTGISVLLWGGVLGVGLSSGGPSHLKLLFSRLGGWVRVYLEKSTGGAESRGWGKGGSRSDKGENNNFLLIVIDIIVAIVIISIVAVVNIYCYIDIGSVALHVKRERESE